MILFILYLLEPKTRVFPPNSIGKKVLNLRFIYKAAGEGVGTSGSCWSSDSGSNPGSGPESDPQHSPAYFLCTSSLYFCPSLCSFPYTLTVRCSLALVWARPLPTEQWKFCPNVPGQSVVLPLLRGLSKAVLPYAICTPGGNKALAVSHSKEGGRDRGYRECQWWGGREVVWGRSGGWAEGKGATSHLPSYLTVPPPPRHYFPSCSSGKGTHSRQPSSS